ncbi:MAG: hypothetical protein J5884_05715 [Paludibacteraceae bacterium]|nr:hypothetical protein [Paludibacteraceae bacterium]
MKKFFMAIIAIMMAASVSPQFYVYLNNGEVLYADSISMVAPPNGMLPGEFSVSATQKVHFSQGNLQATYNGSRWNWSFAAHQWDCIGNTSANNTINGNGSVSSNGTVDLFGWSTAATYYGINNSTSSNTYSGGFVEWGNNPITNGGKIAQMWRTLTKDEWVYLFFGRKDAAKLFSMGKVNGVNGTILLPDNWSGNKYDNAKDGLTAQGNLYSSRGNASFTFHTYDGKVWDDMEKAGAVFLPAAGYRLEEANGDVNVGVSFGYYWSATPYDEIRVYDFSFSEDGLAPQGKFGRYYGSSVRLVR